MQIKFIVKKRKMENNFKEIKKKMRTYLLNILLNLKLKKGLWDVEE